MSLFVSFLIVLFLAVLETSLLPYFQIFGIIPFLTLSFLVALAVRYQGISHIFLALAAGVYFDAISSGFPGTFTLIFITCILVGKIFFFRETGYNASQSFLILLVGSTLFIYAAQGINLLLLNNLVVKDFLIISLVAVLLTGVSGYIIYRIFDKYIDWLNKKSEERYR